MFHRATDIAMLALVGVACMVAVQATWTPPDVTPAVASAHVGETVRMSGMVVDARYFDDGSARFFLVADGAAVHARIDDATDLAEEAWLQATGDLRRDDGVPLLEVRTWSEQRPPMQDRISLAALATRPDDHEDHLVTVPGVVTGDHLTDAGHSILLVNGPDDGPAVLRGVLRYAPTCACQVLHVAESLPWTP